MFIHDVEAYPPPPPTPYLPIKQLDARTYGEYTEGCDILIVDRMRAASETIRYLWDDDIASIIQIGGGTNATGNGATINIFGGDASNGGDGGDVVSRPGVGNTTSGGLDGTTIFQIANGTEVWKIDTSGDLVAGADNTYDIGASGATRPRTAYLGTALNVGSGITPSTANGDIVAGDGTRSLTWDASTAIFRLETSANDLVACALKNTSTGAAAYAISVWENHTGAQGNIGMVSTANTDPAFKPNALCITTSTSLPGGVFISARGASAPIEFHTNSTGSTALNRWTITGGASGGNLIAGADNAYDIGASGATRPRTGYFGTALNVGNGITPSTANGDIRAGDGTREMAWDASAGTLNITGVNAAGNHLYVEGNLNGSLQRWCRNTNTGTSALASSAVRCGNANAALWAASSGNTDVSFKALAAGITLTALTTGGLVLDSGDSTDTPIEFRTRHVVRWRMLGNGSGNHLIAGADNSYDIGASGATRPRTGYFGTALNVGNGITPSTANGDIVAGDGTREMVYDASSGFLTQSGISTTGNFYHATADVNDFAVFRITNSNAGTAAVADFVATNNTGASADFLVTSSTYSASTIAQADSACLISSGTLSGGIFINASGTDTPIKFVTDDVTRWTVLGTTSGPGHLVAGADNTYDIGNSGALRPRRVYVATEVVVGDTITIGSDAITSNQNITITPGGTGAITIDGDLEVVGSITNDNILSGVTEDGGSPNIVTVTDVLRVGTGTLAVAAGDFSVGGSGGDLFFDESAAVLYVQGNGGNQGTLRIYSASDTHYSLMRTTTTPELELGLNNTSYLRMSTSSLSPTTSTFDLGGATNDFRNIFLTGRLGWGSAGDEVREQGWDTTLTDATATGILVVALSSNDSAGGVVDVTVHATDNTDYQSRTVTVLWSAVSKSGTITASASVDGTESVSVSGGGTLTVTADTTTGGGTATIRITATSSLTTTSLVANCHVRGLSDSSLTPQ
jgi:hypothetical protein